MNIALTLFFFLFVSVSFSQDELLDIEGAVTISNTSNVNPKKGTIRFNPDTNDFEGYNGEWVSLVDGPLNGQQVRDIDGNIYNTVDISGVVWMRENLKTTRYKDGSQILEVPQPNDWIATSEGAWCWYDNDERYDKVHGKLYNWYAVDNPSGLCPEGWRVPNNDDINGLFLVLISNLGGKMKEIGLDNWEAPNTGAINETGFSARGSGVRQGFIGQFGLLRINFLMWSSNADQGDITKAHALLIKHDSFDGTFGTSTKTHGNSVRCVKN